MVIDLYEIKQDKRSGLVNDPNGWLENPKDLISAIRRIVQVSVETGRIVAGLPAPVEFSIVPVDPGRPAPVS